MKRIRLFSGRYATVDDEDARLVRKFAWHERKSTNTSYATHGVACRGERVANLHMHSLVMGLPLGQEIDHRDGNGLNNQKANLRLATRAQNLQARRVKRGTKSGYRGVERGTKGWVARLYPNGKSIGLGTYPTPKEAARAYNRAAKSLYGEYARLNPV